MTNKQKLLRTFYPILKWFKKTAAPEAISKNEANVRPNISFYGLSAQTIKGSLIDFGTLKGKKVMIVNVASECGYTSQYEELEEVYRLQAGKVEIIGFPSNDFKGQEPGTDQEIESFCRLNYDISFPLIKKGAVTGTAQQAVFEWLTDKTKNGWNDQLPSWNFCKYLVDEIGMLQQVFPPYISPLEIKL